MNTGRAAVPELELRFLVARDDAQAFVTRVSPELHLDVYDEARPVAYTRTTYFDTDDFTYWRSCDGPVERRLRVRQYAAARDTSEAPVLTGLCWLEFKESAGSLRTKARVSAGPRVISQLVQEIDDVDPKLVARLREAQPALHHELKAEPVRPCLTTWYRRVSLTSASGNVRVTLDEGIAFCLPEAIGEPGAPAEPANVVDYGPGRVVEVKIQGETPRWLAEAMKPLREQARFSKFLMGMRALQRARSVRDKHATMPLVIPSAIRVKSK